MENGDAPATKRDLQQLEDRLVEHVHQQVRQSEERLLEHMRDMQTELLRAFLPFQESISARLQSYEIKQQGNETIAKAEQHEIRERMNILERRLFQIEKKLLLDPPAA